MDCAACARKVENAVRQLAGVNQVQVLFATENLVVDADNDIRAQVESAVQKAGYSLRDEQAADEPQESRLKENLPLITLIVMMAISWGLEQFNHPFGDVYKRQVHHRAGNANTLLFTAGKLNREVLRFVQ